MINYVYQVINIHIKPLVSGKNVVKAILLHKTWCKSKFTRVTDLKCIWRHCSSKNKYLRVEKWPFPVLPDTSDIKHIESDQGIVRLELTK